jgi:predicted transcriptional regulator
MPENMDCPITRKKYLDSIGEFADHQLACKLIGLSPATVQKYIMGNQGYATMVAHNLADFQTKLLREANDRVFNGNREITISNDGKETTRIKFDNNLLQFYLERYIPEFNTTKKLEVTHQNTETVKFDHLSIEEKEVLVKALSNLPE